MRWMGDKENEEVHDHSSKVVFGKDFRATKSFAIPVMFMFIVVEFFVVHQNSSLYIDHVIQLNFFKHVGNRPVGI